MDEISKYNFEYPENLIALDPLENKHKAKMLVSKNNDFFHDEVGNLANHLSKDDLIVFNDTRVLPGRLKATKVLNREGNSFVEIAVTLNKLESKQIWSSFCYPGKRVRVGDKLAFGNNLFAKIKKIFNGLYFMEFNVVDEDLLILVEKIGKMPIPPYISKKRGFKDSDFINYQTTFAKHNGSVAAPTASLHFDEKLLNTLNEKGIPSCFITLHVNGGTFLPIKTNYLSEHVMHSEFAKIDLEAVLKIKKTKDNGGRIIAVGTTTMRVLESTSFLDGEQMKPFESEINTFIKPGYEFKICSGLVTNFHQPKSTLFVLVNAFIGVEKAQALYKEAISSNYRLFSFGDCCLLFP